MVDIGVCETGVVIWLVSMEIITTLASLPPTLLVHFIN